MEHFIDFIYFFSLFFCVRGGGEACDSYNAMQMVTVFVSMATMRNYLKKGHKVIGHPSLKRFHGYQFSSTVAYHDA